MKPTVLVVGSLTLTACVLSQPLTAEGCNFTADCQTSPFCQDLQVNINTVVGGREGEGVLVTLSTDRRAPATVCVTWRPVWWLEVPLTTTTSVRPSVTVTAGRTRTGVSVLMASVGPGRPGSVTMIWTVSPGTNVGTDTAPVRVSRNMKDTTTTLESKSSLSLDYHLSDEVCEERECFSEDDCGHHPCSNTQLHNCRYMLRGSGVLILES